MDQYPAQVEDSQSTIPPSEPPLEIPPSPFKKFLPFIIVGTVLLILLSGILVLSIGKSSTKNIVPTPSPRPTATPFPAPTIPLVTRAATSSSTINTPVKIGRLSFIRNGDIYNSDLATFSLLVKNATPAGDKLSWSPMGNFLAWRPKTPTATPSALVVYNRSKQTSTYIKPSTSPYSELIDYAWSADEVDVAVLSHDSFFNISLYHSATPTSALNLYNSNLPIKQVFWPEGRKIIFLTNEGINSIEFKNASPAASLLINNSSIMNMILSPNGKEVLYSVGDDKKNDLYLVNTDGSNNRLIPPMPAKIDMGTTNLPATTLNNGFIPYAVFFPDGNRLLVGYHYLPNLPLVGIYNLKENSFVAVAPFILYKSDLMVDDLRLLGDRVGTTAEGIPTWQISLFTLEDNSKLGLIRAIPNASSPAFYGRDILPSGNMF
ncbi:hypothetical protein HZB96_02915 [Candidatus Gottesmanbacteria bacterium]|nr:hypothetical protein [Candidatus Gottesmanbacteria bacterium]